MKALVTGGSSGMGLEYCRQLAAMGHDIVMVSNQAEPLETLPPQLAKEYGVQVVGHYQDLSAVGAAQELLEWCKSQHHEIDILINNAGMFFFHELTPDYYEKANIMLRLHTQTPTQMSLLFGEEMKKRRRGYIINMSSLAAALPTPGITIYAATKAYLKSFSKSLFFEMRPYNVGVTTVMPAAIATPLYGLNPKLMNIALKLGVIHTPKWLVKKALRAMFRKRHYIKPSIQNYYLPVMIKLLPNRLEDKIWKRFL